MAISDLFRTLTTGLANGAQAVGSQVGQAVSNMGAGMRPPADPNAIDPNYGLPAGMVHQANMDSLRRMSALFLAAGQSMSGADRARILSGLGDAQSPTRDLYTMAQARLMNEQVSDAMRKRERREAALTNLQTVDMSQLSERDRAVVNAYMQAGDAEGALDYMAKSALQSSQQRNSGYTLPDGTIATLGVMRDNNNDFAKNWAPALQGVEATVQLAEEAARMVESGGFFGSLGEVKQNAAKFLRATVGASDEQIAKILNTENVMASSMEFVLSQMERLGGNDSNEELKRLQASIASGTMEPETIVRNMRRIQKVAIENAARANLKKDRLNSNGSSEYHSFAGFDEKYIPSDPLRETYFRITGKAPADSGTAGGSLTIGAVEDGYRFKGGDPSDSKNWEKVN